MAALTCTDTAPSGSHARSRRGRVVGHAPYIRGARRADLAERAASPLTIMEYNHEPPLHDAIQTTGPVPTEATESRLMPDARYPDRWLTDLRVVRLSDRAHRVFVTGLAWSSNNRTDGRVEPDTIDYMPVRPDRAVCDELVKSGLWARDGQGYVMTVFESTQTGGDELARLEKMRAAERTKKARQRSRRASVPGTVPGDDVTRDDTGEDRQELGQGQEVPSPLGKCRTCGHRERLHLDRRCESCTEWDVQEEKG